MMQPTAEYENEKKISAKALLTKTMSLSHITIFGVHFKNGALRLSAGPDSIRSNGRIDVNTDHAISFLI